MPPPAIQAAVETPVVEAQVAQATVIRAGAEETRLTREGAGKGAALQAKLGAYAALVPAIQNGLAPLVSGVVAIIKEVKKKDDGSGGSTTTTPPQLPPTAPATIVAAERGEATQAAQLGAAIVTFLNQLTPAQRDAALKFLEGLGG